MKTYLVTVTRQAGIGYSYIPATYGIIADTVYQARRQAERLDAIQRPSLPELVSIRAHAVKPGEAVPYVVLDWAYDWELCVRAGVTHAMQTRELANAAGAADRAAAETETDATDTAGTTDTTETEQDKQNAEQTTETAPAAETETAERAAEIADALDDIRHARLAYGYTAKRRVTARCIREAERAGYPTVRVGYCDLQNALSGITPDYYTAGVYGWNCDVYNIAGLNICTGYRPAAGVPAVGVRELAGACRGADTATRDRLFAAWIVTNREIAREGARA